MNWTIHYSAQLSAGAAFASFSLAGALVTIEGQPPIHPAGSAAVAALGATAITSLIVYHRWHQGRICERCFAGMTLTPSEDAARHARTLRMVHRLADRPRWLLMVASMVTVAVLLSTLMWQPWAGGPLIGALFAWSLLALDLHQRLQPWCPWCPHGRGDHDEDPVPVVPPSPALSR
ncbi:hypothetical protein [Nocardiopsis sp. FR26]|uniref:hypothetical protein n=1 Tax=Nocardiopsis sp. FR26 TaxID=2605987 RepID=UPI00135B087C|nr:hypothetical protein [Nocardiopsis sp. FR26]